MARRMYTETEDMVAQEIGTNSTIRLSITSKPLQAESFACILRALDLALDVVTLAEKRVPIVEDFLLVVWQVVPIGSAFFGFE